MPTTTLSAADEALAEDAVNVDVTAAAAAAEPRNERREVSAEVCVMSGAPMFLIRRVNLRESHLHAGEFMIVATIPKEFQASGYSSSAFRNQSLREAV